MTKILLLTIIGCFLISDPQVGSAQTQNQPTNQASGASSQELSAAAQLTADVIKLFAEAKYDDAFPMAKRALEIRDRYLKSDDELIASAAINLAEIYMVKKKFPEAERLFLRALEIYEKEPNQALKVASLLDRLGIAYFSESHYGDSEKALQRSLSIREKALGTENPSVAESLHKLAEFYRFRGEPGKAEPLYDRALMIMRHSLPLNDPGIRKLLEHYSCLLNQTRQIEKLKGLYNKYIPEDVIANSNEAMITGAVLNGRALKLPRPSYPDEARRAHAQGMVTIAVTIDETGKVIEAHDMCGANPLLAKVSTDAAYKAVFTPTKLSGQPVKVNVSLAHDMSDLISR